MSDNLMLLLINWSTLA